MRVANLLTILVTTAALAGCIAFEDEAEPFEPPADEYIPEPEMGPWDGEPVAETLYEESWTSSVGVHATIPVPSDYDYLIVSFTHTGQILGAPRFRSADGEDMDSGLLHSVAGPFELVRVVPGMNGTARAWIDGAGAGPGNIVVTGVNNTPPIAIFHGSWSGQRGDLPIIGTTTRFFVPEGVPELLLSVSASGQQIGDVKILDPDGNEQLSASSGAGPRESGTTVTGTPGLWSILMTGSQAGPLTIAVTGIYGDEMAEDWDIDVPEPPQ